VDYITRSGLSFGAGIGYGTQSSELELDSGTTDGPASSTFLVAPRVGKLLMFTTDVGLWPRGGITYQSGTQENTDPLTATSTETSTTQFLLTLEAPLVIMPSSFGFMLAPTFDYLLSSSVEVDGNEFDGDISGYQFGISFGVFGVL
jgi:hypothetical protein